MANATPYTTLATLRHHHPYQQQHLPYYLAFGQLLCRYRSKVCRNPRAHKRDGSLHRYCEEHRQRANTNQKKWATRRMQAANEIDMSTSRWQLSYEPLLSQEMVLASQGFLSVDPQSQTLSMQGDPEKFEESLQQWTTTKFDEGLPLVDDDKTSDLLWESLGLDELQMQL